jgi:hypothetical protein
MKQALGKTGKARFSAKFKGDVPKIEALEQPRFFLV